MPGKSDPKIWGVATASQLGAALRGARFSITAQDADFKYTEGINPAFLPEGKTLAGLSDDDLFPDVSAEDLKELKRRVYTSGKGGSIDFRFAETGKTGWYRIWAEPITPNGSAGGLLCAAIEITEQKTAEELLRLALLELAHRSKNLLSVVLSVARQSVDESRDLGEFRERFLGRIRSLALAHDVLTDESWRGATIFSLVRSQLSAFSETAWQQATIEGHNAFLKPNAVQYVGLALHELVALSMLSGALSTPEGEVRVTTTLLPGVGKDALALVLRWEESGIRPSLKKKSQFGYALLERIVPAALNGTGRFDETGPQSLVYELRIPGPQFF